MKEENQTLAEYIKANPPSSEFVPSPIYIPEGDVIHYYFSNEPTYNEHVDNHLSLFKTFDGDKIVGVALSGIKECVISAEFTKLKADVVRLRAALREIAEGKGEYDHDPMQHAVNTIAAMTSCAARALEETKP